MMPLGLYPMDGAKRVPRGAEKRKSSHNRGLWVARTAGGVSGFRQSSMFWTFCEVVEVFGADDLIVRGDNKLL